VKDIVALCKAKPGQVSFGSAGAGSAQHLALEMFKLQAKVDALHVPYKGSGPLLTDLIGGQIQYSFETMTAATPHVAERPRRSPSRRRAPARQGPPERADDAGAGFDGFEATTWYGLVGPASCRRRSRRRSTPTSTPCWRCPTCRRSSTPTAPRTAAARPTSSPASSAARSTSGRRS
jgi:tripartite-type tricarboxylate transporter receptor subunit TctC